MVKDFFLLASVLLLPGDTDVVGGDTGEGDDSIEEGNSDGGDDNGGYVGGIAPAGDNDGRGK